MSLFVAIRPGEAASDDLHDAIERVRRLPAAQSLRWQPPALWHLTLAFLGDGNEDLAAEIGERVEDLGHHCPAIDDLRLRGAGCFDRRVVWVGVGDEGAVERLHGVVTLLRARLRGSGAALDHRGWRPHLTVARARDGSARHVAEVLAAYEGPPWTARELLLVRSTGGPRPTHEVLRTARLTDPRG